MMTPITEPAPPLLQLESVRVQYNHSCVLRVPKMVLFPGTILLLSGPNGSGKSSLLCGLAGIGPKLLGLVKYMSHSLAHIPSHIRAQKGLRLLPQGRRVFPRLTPTEHIRLATQSLVTSKNEMTWQPLSLLRNGVSYRPSTNASGGEAKIMLLASIMVPGFRLLMLDEPFSGLDERAAFHILTLLNERCSSGTALIIVDHTSLVESQFRTVTHARIETDAYGYIVK